MRHLFIHILPRHLFAKGEVPEIVIPGDTAGIKQFGELAFYEWIMLREHRVIFPDHKTTLSLYSGPSIDAGPAQKFSSAISRLFTGQLSGE